MDNICMTESHFVHLEVPHIVNQLDYNTKSSSGSV